MSEKLLITGADGFIGSHFLEHILLNTDYDVVCISSWNQDGIPERISHSDHYQAENSRVRFITHDLRARLSPFASGSLRGVNHVVHFAADSNVDRSIIDPAGVIENNVQATLTMLEAARSMPSLKSFVQVSTDEVYGPAYDDYCHKEWDAIIPSNPYSASKACQEAIATSYWRTYGVPVVITNTMNNFGERQHPDKFLPMIIRNIINRITIPVHAVDGQVGSRFYLHARNHSDMILKIIQRSEEIPQYGTPGRKEPHANIPMRFNVVGDKEISNLELVEMVGRILEIEPSFSLVDAHSSRPGHDLRYALDGNKAYNWGWVAPVKFEESLKRTVRWYIDNSQWLNLETVL